MNLGRLLPDPFTLALLLVLVVGAVLPVSGGFAVGLGTVADIAIGLVFFLHGARLQRQVVIAGMRHWRLHSFILATTFLVFPFAGLLLTGLLPSFLAPALVTGLVFMCLLPSTVQSSIAFTSVAGGNVVAAVCAATASNLLGMFLTPLMVGLVLHTSGSGLSLNTLGPILFQLLLPFVAGQMLQRWVGDFVRKQKKLLSFVDRGAILLVVYLAFSGAVVAGLWGQLSIGSLAFLILACFVLLAAILAFTAFGARLLGFSRDDEIAIVFCGSQKSLVSGIPIANALFAGPDLGFIVLPLMLFHQIQLISSALIARRYAAERLPASS